MNFTKKQVIISVTIALIIISAIIFVPAFMSMNKEDKAAEQLSGIYNDQFIVAKSNVGALSKQFEISVQSENSKIVYDFNVDDEQYTGNYFEENVNVKVNELIQPVVPDALVMSNVHLDGLTEEISLEQATVEKATIHLLEEGDLTDELAQQIAQVVKGQFGEIPVEINVVVVEQEQDFEGVKFEVENYFQLSKITEKSFIDFKFYLQNFKF